MPLNAALGGRAVLRLSPPGHLPPLHAEVFYGHSQRRPRRWASPLSSRRSRSRCCSPPVGGGARHTHRLPGHDRQGHDRREARPHRLALADRDRGPVRDRRGQAGDRRRRPVELPGPGADDEALRLHAERRGDRRLQARPRRRLARQQRPAEGARRSSRSRPCSSRRRRTSPRPTGRSAGLGTATGHTAGAAATVDGAEAEDRRDRGGGAEVLEAQLLPGAQPGLLLGDVVDVRRPGLELLGLRNIADAAAKSGSGYPKLSGEYIVSANPDLIVLADTKCCGQTAAKVEVPPGLEHDRRGQERGHRPLSATTSRRAGARGSSTSCRRSRSGCAQSRRASTGVIAARVKPVGGDVVRAPSPARTAVPLAVGVVFLVCSAAVGLLVGPVHLGLGSVASSIGSHVPFLGIHSSLSPDRHRRSSGSSARRASCSACSSAACSRSPAPRTRACSATRSPTRTCSGSPPAPGSARRSRSPTATAPRRAYDLDPAGGVRRRRTRRRRRLRCSVDRPAPAARAAALILAGVTMSAFLTAIQTFVQQQHSQSLQEVYSWILGRLDTSGWHDVGLVAPYILVSAVVIVLYRRVLDVLSVGDEEAASLGVNVSRTRLVIVVFATIGTAAAVAISGLIGFVGIIVPHAIRLALRRELPPDRAALAARRRRVPRARRRARPHGHVAGRAADRRRDGVLRRAVLRRSCCARAGASRDDPIAPRAASRSRSAARSSSTASTPRSRAASG